MAEYKGIDVSSNQDKPNWKKVKADGIQFAILRITQRDNDNAPDSSFEYNFAGCNSNGIPVGVYKFSYAMGAADAKAEAESVVDTLAGRKIQFPVWLDLEYNKQAQLGKTALSTIIKTFWSVISSAGYQFGIYCNKNWYSNYIPEDAKKKYDFWIAGYPYNDDGTIHENLRPSYGVGWQYSSKGKVSGIDGTVDMDVFYTLYEDNKQDQTEQKQEEKKMTEAQAIDAVLAIAEAEEGYHEKNSAANLDKKTAPNDGSGNYTKYGRDMHKLQPSNMDYPAAWCDSFVDWCMQKAFGAETARKVLCGDFDDYTVNSADHYKQAGRWTKTGKRGYQIFFRNSGGICHTGLVKKVSGGKVYTTEGNKSNMVKACMYDITDSTIDGYGMPRYDLVTGVVTQNQSQDTAPTLRKGSKGEDVKSLQKKLNAAGSKLDVDGDFGSKTEAAVKAYQKANGLTADGIVGPLTWAKLNAVPAAEQKTEAPKTTSEWVGRVTASSLNVRTGPGLEYKNLAAYPTLAKGNLVDVIKNAKAKDGTDWYYIRIAGKNYGYVSAIWLTRN